MSVLLTALLSRCVSTKTFRYDRLGYPVVTAEGDRRIPYPWPLAEQERGWSFFWSAPESGCRSNANGPGGWVPTNMILVVLGVKR
jgi:hypothetical protein